MIAFCPKMVGRKEEKEDGLLLVFPGFFRERRVGCRESVTQDSAKHPVLTDNAGLHYPVNFF
jgi:hypothetical protein